MLNLFKKKSPIEKLYDQHEKLLQEAHQLSTVDRKKSDQKHAEAENILKEIERIEQEK